MVRRRVRHAHKQGKPIVVDLFSGVGGLSLGASRAGFHVAAAVEIDPIASETHAFNFPATSHLDALVHELSGSQLLKALDLERGEIDGLVGGPPCQGFSEIGRKKRNDPRNALFGHFFRLVAETRPKFFLAENVPGIMTARYARVREAAFARLPKCYELVGPLVVTASDLGAPTSRTRIFFLGVDADRLPSVRDLPLETQVVGETTVRKALAGLPAIRSEWQEETQGWRKVDDVEDGTFFQRIRGLIPEGVGNEIAVTSHKNERLVSGCLGTLHTTSTINRFRGLRPGEVDPVSRAIRLDPNGLCPTIRAGTGPDQGSYQAVRPIHPSSPRVITPREAARLQGFPDWFVFHPTKWHAFRQIGNSVSPIVAEAILKAIKRRGFGSEN